MKAIVLIVTLCCFTLSESVLQSVSDDDVLQLIKDYEKLIVFFTKPDCEVCRKYEVHIEGLQEDFEKHLNAFTVKAVNSHLVKLYSPTKEPAIVFFRHGIPMLYNGDADETAIYTFLQNNQSPAVKEMTDKIFEHMTQAATGATTGDWFVMFYGASCVECQRLHAVWEGVGATLRGRINVARVDASLAGVNTAKRFKVTKLPTFLFFRLGKVYKYDLPKNNIKSFVSFAQDWYKNVKGNTVPLLPSPFDDLVDWCVEMIQFSVAFGLDILVKHPWIWQIGVAGFGLVAVTALIAVLKAGQTTPIKYARKEKKNH